MMLGRWYPTNDMEANVDKRVVRNHSRLKKLLLESWVTKAVGGSGADGRKMVKFCGQELHNFRLGNAWHLLAFRWFMQMVPSIS